MLLRLFKTQSHVPLILLRAETISVLPNRTKIYLHFRRDQTKIYRGPQIKLDPLRNKHKRDVPLFFGQLKPHHPVQQAGGSLSWAEPIFEMYKKKLEGIQEEESQVVHKLHAVQRIPRTLYGVERKLKKIMKALGLHHDQVPMNEMVILKNSEEVNDHLRQVKHLVRIQPVTFPNGEPKDESDLEHMYLTENAEMIVRQKLHAIDVVDERSEDKWAMEKDTIVRGNRKRLQEQRVALEYFPPKYVYKFNQDGKEFRYTHNVKKDSS